MANGREGAILQAVGFAAERFLAAADWRAAIDEVLKQIGVASQVSRAHFYRVDRQDNEVFCTLLHEWVGHGVTPQIDNPLEQRFPMQAGGYGRWVTLLGAGELIEGVRSEFPGTERDFMESEDITSALVVPIFVEGRWWGWIGFDDTNSERRWSQAESDALRTAAAIIGAAIQRERMERQRLTAEAKYRSLVEQLPSVTYMATADSENRTLYISPQVHDLLGYSPADWVKTRGLWSKLIHPDDAERAIAVSEEANRTGEPISMEYRMRTRYGGELWVHEEAVLFKDGSGVPMYWQGVMIDVTAQKQAEAALRETEARYRALIEQLPAITYRDTFGPGPLLYISPQIEEVTGYTPEEWLTNIWLTVVHEDDRERVAAAEEEADRSGERFLAEYRLVRKDGRVVWIHDEAIPVVGDDGMPLYWQGVMIDFTERRQAEERLREAEERYQSLVEKSPAATYMDEPEGYGVTVYVSPQIVDLLGYPVEDWLKDPDFWLDHVYEDDRSMVIAAEDRCDVTGDPFELEYRMVRADGEVVWIQDAAIQVRDESGQLRYWHGLMWDITERRKNRELEWALQMERGTSQRLRDMDESKNTFIAALSHDFRTPLAVILGLAMTMEREEMHLTDGEVHGFAARIAAQSRKLDRLVTDLLDLERLSKEGGEPVRRDTALRPLVEGVVEGLPEPGVRIHVECDDDARALIDKVKTERIVENLLVNAVNHTPEASDVWVRVIREDGRTTFLVEDSGAGVPDELKEAVFEPFRRGEDAGPQGLGVGLSLVKRFAESHGGDVWVGDREGGGASFGVMLPDES